MSSSGEGGGGEAVGEAEEGGEEKKMWDMKDAEDEEESQERKKLKRGQAATASLEAMPRTRNGMVSLCLRAKPGVCVACWSACWLNIMDSRAAAAMRTRMRRASDCRGTFIAVMGMGGCTRVERARYEMQNRNCPNNPLS